MEYIKEEFSEPILFREMDSSGSSLQRLYLGTFFVKLLSLVSGMSNPFRHPPPPTVIFQLPSLTSWESSALDIC